MQILKKNYKQGWVQLKVEDLEDLWYLHQIIDPTDLLKGKATRKIKIGETVAKKTYTLTIEAETITWDPESLRINGKIKEAPEELALESYQAIALEPHSICTLTKPRWLSYQKKKLEDATQRKGSVLILLVDRQEAIIASTKPAGFEILTKLQGQVQKKRMDQKTEDFFGNIVAVFEEYATRLQPTHCIVASPAFYKEEIIKRLSIKVIGTTCSSISAHALQEVITQPELKNALQNSQQRQAQVLVDQLLQEINKQGLAVYGWQEVTVAIDAGAVADLLLTDTFIRKRREEKTFAPVDTALQQVDALQAGVHILTGDPAKTIDGLGGIAALLRYKLR